jgi:hypothetical protein
VQALRRSQPGLRALGWLRFLKQIDRDSPRRNTLHLICGPRAALGHPTVQAWLAGHPRFNCTLLPGRQARRT